MSDMISSAQTWIVLLLGVAALAMEVYAFVEALRYPDAAYRAAGKLTKPAWLGITGVAAMIGFVYVRSPLGLGLVSVVAAGVFLADVRPAVRPLTRRKGGGASGRGPYGSW